MLQSQLAEQKVLNAELQIAINTEKEEKEEKEKIQQVVVSHLVLTFSLAIDDNSLIFLSITKNITFHH